MLKNNGKYNSAKFMIPAKDHKGRSVKARFRINPEDRNIVEAIIASRRFPYRFPCDLYRHAVKVLCAWLSSIEDLNALIADYQMAIDSPHREDIGYYRLVFDVLRCQVEHHLSSGRNGEARRALQQFVGHSLSQPRSYGRDRCLERVREKWGPLLEGVYYPACLRHERLPSLTVRGETGDE